MLCAPPAPGLPGEPVFLLNRLLKKLASTPSLAALSNYNEKGDLGSDTWAHRIPPPKELVLAAPFVICPSSNELSVLGQWNINEVVMPTFNSGIWFLDGCYWRGTGDIGRTRSALRSWWSRRPSCRRFLYKSTIQFRRWGRNCNCWSMHQIFAHSEITKAASLKRARLSVCSFLLYQNSTNVHFQNTVQIYLHK